MHQVKFKTFKAFISASILALLANTCYAADADKAAQVSINKMAFDPATVTITTGEKVTWTNNDSVSHKVLSKDGTVKSDDLAQGDSFSQSFDKVGTYEYYCAIHPSMTGKVVVEQAK